MVEGVASVDESGDHRGVRPRDPRIGWRSQRRHRRHEGAVGPDRRARSRSEPGATFIDRMIALVEGAERQKTPNEIALNILLASLTIIFLLATVTLQPFAIYSGAEQPIARSRRAARLPDPHDDRCACSRRSASPAWTGSCSATSSRCPAGPSRRRATCNTLLLDKTGTITLGNRQAAEFLPAPGVDESSELADAAQLSSLADETPEGRSIVVLAKERYGAARRASSTVRTFVPFTAQTRMSGVDFDGRVAAQGCGRLGAALGRGTGRDVRRRSSTRSSTASRPAVGRRSSSPSGAAGRPPCSASSISRTSSSQACGERFAELRAMGIRTVMITGDNPLHRAPRSRTRPASTTSSPRRRPRTRWR